MQIVFCDTCGIRVPQADIDSRAAKRIEDNVFVCSKCTVKSGPHPVQTQAPVKKETVEIKRPALTAETGHTPHGHGARATTRRGTRVHERPTDSGRAPAAPASTVPTMALIWGGAAVALILAIFLLSGSPGKGSEQKPQPANDTPVPQSRSSADSTTQQPRVALVSQPESPPVQKLVAPPEPPRAEAKPTDVPVQKELVKEPEHKPAPVEALRAPEIKAEPTKPEPVKEEPAKMPGVAPEKANDVDDSEAKTNKTGSKTGEKQSDPKKTEPDKNKTPAPSAPKTPQKPAFVRGKPCDLFPADRTSRSENLPDPRNGGKSMAMTDKFDGWTWNCKDLQGFSVKEGVLSIDKQGIMQLDQYPCLEYKLSYEVELSKNSGVALLCGANGAIVNLFIITDTHAMSGVWDQGKTENNVNADGKGAKLHGSNNGWIQIQAFVHPESIDFTIGSKPVANLKFSKSSSMPQLGFMLLGTNKNNNPTCKIRKATLNAP